MFLQILAVIMGRVFTGLTQTERGDLGAGVELVSSICEGHFGG